MEEFKKYSPWEYEEQEGEEQDDPEKNPDGTPKDPNAEDKDPEKNPEDDYSDDTPVKVKIDGKIVEMTAGELAAGYMRQSDYTRKTQDLKKLPEKEQKEEIEKAKDIVDNPENFKPEDIATAEYLLKIAKSTGIAKKLGLMTREDYDAEESKKKMVSEFSSKLDSAKTEVGKMTVSYQENGKTVKFSMPAWNEDEILNFMQESGINDPVAAYLRKYDAQYRDFIIKQAKGTTSYKSDKGGKKIEPNDKPLDVRTEEGHRSFLSEEIKKLQDK
jgi:hypothetical protein